MLRTAFVIASVLLISTNAWGQQQGQLPRSYLIDDLAPIQTEQCKQSEAESYCSCLTMTSVQSTQESYNLYLAQKGRSFNPSAADIASNYTAIERIFAEELTKNESACRDEASVLAAQQEEVEAIQPVVDPGVWDASAPVGMENNTLFQSCAERRLTYSHFDCACIATNAKVYMDERVRENVELRLQQVEGGRDYRTSRDPEYKAEVITKLETALAIGDFSNVGDLAVVGDDVGLHQAYASGKCFSKEQLRTSTKFECEGITGYYPKGNASTPQYCSCVGDKYADSWNAGDIVQGPVVAGKALSAASKCSHLEGQ